MQPAAVELSTPIYDKSVRNKEGQPRTSFRRKPESVRLLENYWTPASAGVTNRISDIHLCGAVMSHPEVELVLGGGTRSVASEAQPIDQLHGRKRRVSTLTSTVECEEPKV